MTVNRDQSRIGRPDHESRRALSPVVSEQMRRMPTRDTKPELALRRELHARGMRFRVHHPQLPGRPDISFTRARLAVFVDGCFWHACPQHGSLPKNNRDWWRIKLLGNQTRDHAKDEALNALGYSVFHFWEHEDPAASADAIETVWRKSTGRAARQPTQLREV